MGFRQSAFARIWTVNDEGKYSTANISVSKKNKETGNYVVEFNDGYVRLVGAAHEAAKQLGLPTREQFDPQSHKGVSIKILSCDVTNNYDKNTKKLYTNCAIFEFELPDGNGNTGNNQSAAKSAAPAANKQANPPVAEDDDELPF